MPLHLPGSLANVKAVMGERRFRGEHLVYIMQQGAIGLVKLHRFKLTTMAEALPRDFRNW